MEVAVHLDFDLNGVRIANSPYSLCGRKATLNRRRAQELRESRCGHPGLPVHNNPYGLCGRKATLNKHRIQEVAVLWT